MRKKFQFIFAIAVLTATGILIFQLYWVYSVYMVSRENLNKTLTAALDKSIVSYELQQNVLPTSLKNKAPTLSVFMDTTVRKKVPDSLKSMLENARTVFTVQYKSLAINSDDLPLVKLMLARLIAQQLDTPINLNALVKNYKNELIKENLPLSFNLVLHRNQKIVGRGCIGVIINFLKTPTVIEAEFGDLGLLSLKRNVVPAIVSFILICLSAGCLFYMGHMIRTQIRLDDIKNDFINNVTHELRTPISILNTSNEALLHFGAAEDPQKIYRYLQINTTILQKLSENVGRILDITQYEEGYKLAKMELVKINDLIEHTLRLFEVRPDLTISFINNLNQAEVVTDSYMIGAIISNLMDNAIKYCKSNPVVEVILSGSASSWQLIVKDNGIGMDAAILPFIYDKFFRIQNGDLHEVKGYGLGLNYVKQLILNLRGTIKVESELRKGTTFIINFPQ